MDIYHDNDDMHSQLHKSIVVSISILALGNHSPGIVFFNVFMEQLHCRTAIMTITDLKSMGNVYFTELANYLAKPSLNFRMNHTVVRVVPGTRKLRHDKNTSTALPALATSVGVILLRNKYRTMRWQILTEFGLILVCCLFWE